MGEDRGLNNSFSGVHAGYDYDAAPRFLRRIFFTISWDAYSELRDPRANTNAGIAVAQSAVSRGGFLGGALAMRIGRSGHRHRVACVSHLCAVERGNLRANEQKESRRQTDQWRFRQRKRTQHVEFARRHGLKTFVGIQHLDGSWRDAPGF